LLEGAPAARDAFTARQRFKYRHLSKWWYPYFYFCFQYFVRLGILDGAAGLQHAVYKFWYFLTINLILREAINRR
jgi:hypothetical protein